MSSDVTVTQLVAFLNGAMPLEGRWFGDCDERGRAFWWRKYLAALADAQGEPVQMQDVAALVSALERLASTMDSYTRIGVPEYYRKLHAGYWRDEVLRISTALAKHERTPHDRSV